MKLNLTEKLGADADQIGICLGAMVAFMCVWETMQRHVGLSGLTLGVLATWGGISTYRKVSTLKWRHDEYQRILRQHGLDPYQR